MSLSIKEYFFLNAFFLFFISLNNVFNLDLIKLTIVLSTFVYAIKWNNSEYLVPFFLLIWGIFQDILLGFTLGYSGSIFLYFYILSQLTFNYGIFEQQNLKFIIFASALLIFFILKNLSIYLNYKLNYFSVGELLSYLILVILYFPINSLILYIQKKYEKTR